MPPKTNSDNYISIPHIVELYKWFIANEKQMSLVASEFIKFLFKENYVPESDNINNPKNLEPEVFDTPLKWLIARTWLDMIFIKQMSQQQNLPLEICFDSRINFLIPAMDNTILKAGTIAHKYNIDEKALMGTEWENELLKINNNQDKEVFKCNYIADTIYSAEIRMLSWAYKELFNKDFKVRKVN